MRSTFERETTASATCCQSSAAFAASGPGRPCAHRTRGIALACNERSHQIRFPDPFLPSRVNRSLAEGDCALTSRP